MHVGIGGNTIDHFEPHALPVAENVLAQTFVATRPNETWVTDITYIWTQEGWLYLAVILDLFSRRVVGWAMSERITPPKIEPRALVSFGIIVTRMAGWRLGGFKAAPPGDERDRPARRVRARHG